MAKFAAQAFIKRMVANKIDVSQSVVAILGVTFKDDCPDIRNSKVFDLIAELESWGVTVIPIDPWASRDLVQAQFGHNLADFSLNLQVDSVVVAVGHEVFKDISAEDFKSICKSTNPVFADLKGIYSKEKTRG